jgi:hypothetical protein
VSSSPIYPIEISLPLLSAQISLTWRTLLPPTHHPIINIMDELSRLAAFLKVETIRTHGRIYQEAQFAASHVNPILHRLLSLSLSTTTETASNTTTHHNEIDISDSPAVLQEATRLAAILYLAEIRRNFGILPVVSTIQLSKLQSLLSRSSSHFSLHHPPNMTHQASTSPWTPFPALHLWVIAMGVVESRGAQQRAWFGERMFEVVNSESLAVGVVAEGPRGGSPGGAAMEDAIQEVLKRFLWIGDLHGVVFRRNIQPWAQVALEEV